MGHLIRASLVAVGVVVVGIVCLGLFVGDRIKTFPLNGRGVLDKPEQVLSYHPSDEAIDVYEIANNPYVLRGHSGILDPTELSVFSSVGKRFRLGRFASSLRFEKMLDENTATFEVMSGEDWYGELAVALRGSQPPDTSKLWRVFVDDPVEGLNGFGTPRKITKIVFEGYYEPSAEEPQKSSPPVTTMQQEPPPSTQEESQPAGSAPNSAGPETTSKTDSHD